MTFVINPFTGQFDEVGTSGGGGGGTGTPAGPSATNLGISYDAGTGQFSITGAAGALSPASPAVITLPNTSVDGQFVTVNVTADQSFSDAIGTNDLLDNLFGLASGVNNSGIPFYVYAVIDSNATNSVVTFAIARLPHFTNAGSTNGCIGTATANNFNSFFFLGTVNLADYASSPCVCVGVIVMDFVDTPVPNSWRLQVPDASLDGIGRYRENTVWTTPIGQNSTVNYFYNSGGAPTFDNVQCNYTLNRLGWVTVYFNASAQSGLGSGTQALAVYTPYKSSTPGNQGYTGYVANVCPETNSNAILATLYLTSGNAVAFAAPDTTFVQEGFFSAGIQNATITSIYSYQVAVA